MGRRRSKTSPRAGNYPPRCHLSSPHNKHEYEHTPISVRLLAVAATVLTVAATGCTKPAPTPGDLTIDLSPDITVCALDQASPTVDGTSFPVDLHADRPGTWTLDSVTAEPADGVTITKSWVLPEPDPDNAVFGVGFPVPPAKDSPAQVAAWGSRQPIPGARITGDPATSAVVLQLNRTSANAGKFTGLVLTYTDASGNHRQTATGFSVTLNPPGTHC